MAQESGFADITRSAGTFEDFLRGNEGSGDSSLVSGANVDIGKLRSDVDALRQIGSNLGASDAVKNIVSRFADFTSGGGQGVTDPEVSLATESNLRQQSNVLNAIQSQAALLGPGATSALAQDQGRALTEFGVRRANIPTEVRDKFFAQFTPLLQQSLQTEVGVAQATIGAEQSVQAFDLGISNQALSNSLNFGPIEKGRFGQQKEISNIAAQAQIDAAKAQNSGGKGASIGGAVGSLAGAFILANPIGGAAPAAGAVASDFTLKDQVDFIDQKKALEIIRSIHGFKWDWIDGSGEEIGVIAQEVQKVFPEAVFRDELSGVLMVKYPALVGLMIAAMGELAKRVEVLQQVKEEKDNGTK